MPAELLRSRSRWLGLAGTDFAALTQVKMSAAAVRMGMCMETETARANTDLVQEPRAAPACCNAQPRILIVDDDPDALAILRIYLQSQDLSVLSAQDGTTAWTLVQEYLPDVIVTDYQMPELSGVDLARLVRSTARTCHIPILVHSAYDADSVKDPLYDDWFEKPTDLTSLGNTIRDRLARGHTATPANS